MYVIFQFLKLPFYLRFLYVGDKYITVGVFYFVPTSRHRLHRLHKYLWMQSALCCLTVCGCAFWLSACARCLLQLQCVRQVAQWSTTSTAPYGSLPRLASFIQPNLLNNTLHQVELSLHTCYPCCLKHKLNLASLGNEEHCKLSWMV